MGFSSLRIGSNALLTAETALNTVGQNIANASTDGYSRQEVKTAATLATVYSYGAVGTGVEVTSIKSVTDEFLEQEVRSALSTSSSLEELQTGYDELETYFNELSENDISSAMDSYWSAVSDVADNVEDTSTRSAMLEEAVSLANSMNSLAENLTDMRTSLNSDIIATVSDVNSIIKQIAELNVKIVETESGGASGVYANDLRDQREVLIKSLSEIMDVSVTQEDNSSTTLSIGSRLLVYQDNYYELTTEQKNVNDFLTEQVVFAADKDEVDIGDGLLYGQMRLRDEIIPSYQDELDQLAGSLIWETNRVLSQGCGLEGYSELTGTTTVLNPEATLDSLIYNFTPEDGTYEIGNGSFSIIVYDAESGEETSVNIEIDLDGVATEPDTILYDDTNPTAANSLVNMIQDALDSVAQGAFTVSINSNGQLAIESNLDEYQFGFGSDTSGVLAALGLNCMFSGHDATTMAVNEIVYDNPDYLGCASGFTPGDNTVILSLLDMRQEGVVGGSTLDDYYESIVNRMGVEASRIDSEYETAQDVLTYAENQRESLSGVSTDEELTKMIMFQRMYQGAARFISTVNECYETLINM